MSKWTLLKLFFFQKGNPLSGTCQFDCEAYFYWSKKRISHTSGSLGTEGRSAGLSGAEGRFEGRLTSLGGKPTGT